MVKEICGRLSKLSFGTIVAKTGYYFFKHPIIWCLSHFGPGVDDRKIIFESNPDYGDNSRALFEYLVEHGYHQTYKIYWIVEEPEKYREIPGATFVRKRGQMSKSRTIRAFYHIFTSRYLFFTHTFNWFGEKNRAKQVYINLWHGCGYKAAKDRKEVIQFNYCLVPGPIFISTKQDFFQCKKEQLLPIGYPRYDWMMAQNDRERQKWMRICPDATKLVLWMPTFRKSHLSFIQDDTVDSRYGIPLLGGEQEIEKLNTWCKQNKIVLMIKIHMYQVKAEYPKKSNLLFVCNEDLDREETCLYRLVGCSDALITDYSSIAVDYMLLDKPMAFVLTDMEQYQQSRGFVFEHPLDYMPGEKVYEINQLRQFLEHVAAGVDIYREDRKKLLPQMHHPTESYCRRIVEYFQL